MMRSFRPVLLVLTALLAMPSLGAQDPDLKNTLMNAKTLWASDGNREGAVAKFQTILDALEPAVKNLDPSWTRVLCETYNWMAVLDDRTPNKQALAAKHLDLMLDLDPDFEIDRSITNKRVQNTFDTARATRFVKVKPNLDPADGILLIDGKPKRTDLVQRYLLPGIHTFTYTRLGYQPQEAKVDLAPAKEAKSIDLKLVRTSSVVTVFASPVGAEVFLDGKSRGVTKGMVPNEKYFLAERMGLKPEQLSEGLQVADLAPGKHTLEVRLPCYKTIKRTIPEAWTTPFADAELEPVKLEPSRGSLTIQSAAPGGELFLNGLDMGKVPVQDLQVCAQPYDLQVKYPAGSFTQHIEVLEGKGLSLAVRPKARVTYAGFEGADEFAGRDRILGMLSTFGNRLHEVAFLTAGKGESLKDCQARLKATKDTELVLWGRPVPGRPIHEIELFLHTLTGEEERIEVKPLENDPLGALAARMDRTAVLTVPWAGLTVVDLAEGAYVLQADAGALKAGVRTGAVLTDVAGKPHPTVADYRRALVEAKGGQLSVAQGDAPVKLTVTPMALELPVKAQDLCYPMVLADLRLRYLGAQGDEASLFRLHQALALMHFREFDKALEVLRDARMVTVQGVSQGTLDYYTGFCLLRMGNVYLSEGLQAFNQALKYPQATLFGPDGPLLAPLARQALQDVQP